MKARIRAERKRLGLKQKQLATCFGVSTEWLIYGNKGEVSGDRIKKARKERGLSQRQLGAMMGIAANNISFWERGVNNPTAGNLKKLADCLCVTIDWLEEGDRNRCSVDSKPLDSWKLPDDFDTATFTDSPIALPWICTDPESPAFGQIDHTSLFTFKADFFRLLGLHPKHLAMLSVTDNAMNPTISRSDIVLVDTQDTNVDCNSGAVFLVSYKKQKLAIRRVERNLADYLIWTDKHTLNQASTISKSEWDDFSVIGKVMFKLGSV